MRNGAVAHPVSSPNSFSGAAVWRVEAAGRTFALRQWQERMDADRLNRIHEYQRHLGEHGPPIVPLLQRIEGSIATLVIHAGRHWELATWMPGAADFRQNPTAVRLEAAMHALAAIHRASPESGTPRASSASLARRAQRLNEIVTGETELLRQRLESIPQNEDRTLAQNALTLVDQLAPHQRVRARYWQGVQLPQQWRLGDVHHDHVLFTDDRVTGLVDFGAADYDSRAGDVARLLGSLVGDDRAQWKHGLAAYQAAHQMTPNETAAVAFFDASGTVIAAANWLNWLWPESPAAAVPPINRSAALSRLRSLITRLKVLSAARD